jgi:hypothetical protein
VPARSVPVIECLLDSANRFDGVLSHHTLDQRFGLAALRTLFQKLLTQSKTLRLRCRDPRRKEMTPPAGSRHFHQSGLAIRQVTRSRAVSDELPSLALSCDCEVSRTLKASQLSQRRVEGYPPLLFFHVANAKEALQCL